MSPDEVNRVLAYSRLSKGEPNDGQAGIEAQRLSMRAEAERRGWTIVDEISDVGYTAANLKRPGIQEAFQRLADGDVDALVIARIDRLSRSLLDFAGVMKMAQHKGWALIALDLGVDTSTPAGKAMASMLSVFAEFERELISQRTKEALAIKRSQGVQLGRPRELDPDVRTRVETMVAADLNDSEIARLLNAEEVPTARGARWWPSTIRHIRTQNAR
jgi:DNA invertase Pin-like site-specific DNA recombinase